MLPTPTDEAPSGKPLDKLWVAAGTAEEAEGTEGAEAADEEDDAAPRESFRSADFCSAAVKEGGSPRAVRRCCQSQRRDSS